MTTEKAFMLVEHARGEQKELWGYQALNWEEWLTILVEEVGEVARAIQEHDPKAFLLELSQVAAVAIQIMESVE